MYGGENTCRIAYTCKHTYTDVHTQYMLTWFHFMASKQRPRFMRDTLMLEASCLFMYVYVCMYVCMYATMFEQPRNNVQGSLETRICMYVCMYVCMRLCFNGLEAASKFHEGHDWWKLSVVCMYSMCACFIASFIWNVCMYKWSLEANFKIHWRYMYAYIYVFHSLEASSKIRDRWMHR